MAGNNPIDAYAKAMFMKRPKRKSERQRGWRLGWLLVSIASLSAQPATKWDQPAAQLSAQVAAILGAGQAQLTLTNRSTIATAEMPAIRRLLEQDLRAHGVAISGTESANVIRVTLSENARERLWVAEVIEGSQTQVAMVHLDRGPAAVPLAETGMVLEKKRVWNSAPADLSPLAISDGLVLAALETQTGLVVLEDAQVVIFARTAAEWREMKRFPIGRQRGSSRDARGMLVPMADGYGFTAYTAEAECSGSFAPSTDASARYGDWAVHCHESDEPWPVPGIASPQRTESVKAFYNASRNFFTGVVTPNPGVDLTPFYSVALVPRADAGHAALLLNGLDGKVELVEGSALKAVSGTRDWGSDFAVVHSGCGAGTQILATSSGEAASDSLRAYELPAQEAVSVSASLEMGGAIVGLATAPDGASVWAVVRKSAKDYEVDRVTALCP